MRAHLHFSRVVVFLCAAVADGIAPPLVWTCPPCFPRLRERSSSENRPICPVNAAGDRSPGHRWALPRRTHGFTPVSLRVCGGNSRLLGIVADLAQTMSKLSFRARALDAVKPLPVYRHRDLPDLSDCVSINRAVPQMPTGMEKEEELVRHLLSTRSC